MIINSNPLFNKSLSKSGRKAWIQKFQYKHPFSEEDRNQFGRVVHPALNLIGLGMGVIDLMIDKPIAAAVLGVCSYISFGLDKMFHNIAMRKSQLLVKYLKAQGMSENEELTKMIDCYLKYNGGLLYSNFVRSFQKDKLRAVANGEKASQIPGLMSYLRDKFTLLTPASRNEAQAVKRKRNLKKIFQSIG